MSSIAVYDELIRFALLKTDDPAIQEKQRHAARVLLDITPGVREALLEERRNEDQFRFFARLFERRLDRRLSDKERHVLHIRLALRGPERVGDVVFDFTAEQLGAWLSDPEAR
jgi:hypothetical protein